MARAMAIAAPRINFEPFDVGGSGGCAGGTLSGMTGGATSEDALSWEEFSSGLLSKGVGSSTAYTSKLILHQPLPRSQVVPARRPRFPDVSSPRGACHGFTLPGG